MSKTLLALFSATFLVFAASPLHAQGDDISPTAYIGGDLEGLEAASKADPDNIGLRMRVIRRLLGDVRESTDMRDNRARLNRVEKELEAIKKLGPDFTYVHRVLALQHFRRRQNDEFLKMLVEYEKISPLDYELRSKRVKALLRLATSDGDPARKQEAAAYVGNWFDSGEAPEFGTTMGACAAWLVDDDFRDALLEIFEERYEKNPTNLNLVISYAACLANLGRNETAWNLVHRAEKIGLCDDLTGGRHPVTGLLRMQCPEIDATDEHYEGYNREALEALAAKHPENASLHYRLALRLRHKAAAAEKIVALCEKRLQELSEKPGIKDVESKRKTLESRRVEWTGKKSEYYKAALENGAKVLQLNDSIEAAHLLMGDVYAKLGRNAEAIKYINQSLAKVPFYTALRERLARCYIAEKRFGKAADELVQVCNKIGVKVDNWKDEEVIDSLLPRPVDPLEVMLVDLVKDPEAKDVVLARFAEAANAQPRNPNLKSFLAMMHYFAGNKKEASQWMLSAERQGLCGEDGVEYGLATYIYAREKW